jgi:signal transduction histidine kinase
LRGLRVQLALFYILLSLPALLFIEHASIAFKFERLLRELDDGRVQRVLDAKAASLAADIKDGASNAEMELRLQRFVLQLERPRESLGTSAAYVLLELARHPLHAELSIDGQSHASAGPALPSDPDLIRRSWSSQVSLTPGTGSADRAPMLQLRLDLAVPSPWQRFGDRLSFEWPIAVFYLLLFLVGSAWFLRRRVLIRIERMSAAARAWAGGNFRAPIADRGRDELGALAAELDRMAVDLESLVATRAQLATQAERGRLARDLHDTVKQKVFALSLQIDAAREGSADAARSQQRLAEASSLVEEIQRELAEQLSDLGAPSDAAEDLVPALQGRLADFSRRSGCAVRDQLPEGLALPATTCESVLRIVDEALANVWRHARASRVDVQLSLDASRAQLTLADDGRGGAAASAGGMGIANMRHRAAGLAGGSLQLETLPGGGTRVQLSFDAPMPPEATRENHR